MEQADGTVNSAAETRLASEEVRQSFGEVVDRAWSGETIIITRHDRDRAVILSPREYERLRQLDTAAA